MPLFSIRETNLEPIQQSNFLEEKYLQKIVEANLRTIFNCRFVASEFSTGPLHGGRVDTLALSEDNNPVIVEYKKTESSDLINQSLFYLSWIRDHVGDFSMAAQTALSPDVQIDWSDIRVICIAPNYKKYDLHAAQIIGDSIELWTYRLFKNSTIYFEQVQQKAGAWNANGAATRIGTGKNPVMVAAGKKAAATRAAGSYTFDQHLLKAPPEIRQLAMAVQDFLRGLDPMIEELPKKLYVAYRLSQNIVCMEIQKAKVVLFLKLDPTKEPGIKRISRDVSNIGHYGTGNLEITLKQAEDFEASKPLILKAYQAVGG